MRKTFQKWLFLVVGLAFAALFAITFAIQTNSAYSAADELIDVRLQDVEKQIASTLGSQNDIRQITRETLEDKVRTLSLMMEWLPSITNDAYRLMRVRTALGSDEINIIDRHSIIKASSVDPVVGEGQDLVGYNMKSHPQSEAFANGIDTPDFLLVQPATRRGIDRKYFQYAGATRHEPDGMVQVGEVATRLQYALEAGGIQKLSDSLRIGRNGQTVICIPGNPAKVVAAAQADFEGRTLDSLGLDREFIGQLLGGDGSFVQMFGDAKVRGRHRIVEFQDGKKYLLIGFLPYTEVNRSRDNMVLLLLLFGLITLLVIFASISKLVQAIVIDGIDHINLSLSAITSGKLDVKVTESANRELAQLSGGINTMVDALKQAIAAEKSRLNSELDFARTVQAAALPQIHPDSRFGLSASMDTAKEVGGDFYDFFRIDDNRLAFLIADVSGKGIPAAMFMMTAKAQLKSGILGAPDRPLNETIAMVNDSICEGNDACMFVTVFAGILDLSSGMVQYVNAGHNAPILRRADGSSEWLHVESGFVIGGMDGVPFDLECVQLEKGDSILLYTDGVTEAMNPANQLYGDERLIDLMNSPIMQAAPQECILDEIKSDVRLHVSGAPQSDDITMVLLRYQG